jgi:hypothetical protein
VRVRSDLEHLSVAAGREQDRLGAEDVKVPGRDLVGDDPPANAIDQDEVEHEELVVELDPLLVALLEKRLQDHVPGPVGRVARPFDWSFSVVPRVTPEPALVDLAFRRSVEGKAHALEVQYRINGFLAHDVDRVLIGEEVAAFDGVERVPLPRVLFDIR